MKDDSYFNHGPSVSEYFDRLLEVLETHLTNEGDEDPADLGKMINGLFCGSIEFSSSIGSAMEHLKIVAKDVGA